MLIKLSILLCLFSIACMPIIKMENGRTKGKGKKALKITAAYLDAKEIRDGGVPLNMEIAYQYGVTERLDVSVFANTVVNWGLNTKYQVHGDKLSKTAFSLGIDLQNFWNTKETPTLVHSVSSVNLPLYLSYHPNKRVYYFLIPHYTRQITKRKNVNPFEFLGVSGGVGFFYKNFEFNAGMEYNKILDLGSDEKNIIIDENVKDILQFGIKSQLNF